MHTPLELAKEVERVLSDKLLQTANWMMAAHGTQEFKTRQDVYYPLLDDWRKAKKALMEL